jgi:hypothetical protein
VLTQRGGLFKPTLFVTFLVSSTFLVSTFIRENRVHMLTRICETSSFFLYSYCLPCTTKFHTSRKGKH